MKKVILLLITIVSTSILAQGEAPEGWDKIYLENEIAYMNTLTGEVSTTFPKGYARAKKKVVNYNNNFEPIDLESNGTHRVVNGDTFSKIARKYNMSLSELYSLNNLDNFNKLEIGQEISIHNNINEGSEYHTVKTKETLYRISQKYGISVTELKSLNNLDSNTISVGQRLIVR